VTVENLVHDVRFACRGLWRARSVAGAAVLTLAVGMAGTTVMFALVQGVLLRPLPVREQDRLILAWKEAPGSGFARYPFGDTEIREVAGASTLLEEAAGVTRNGVGRAVMVDAGAPAHVNVAEVTGGFFAVLGVEAVLGRTLLPGDDRAGAEHVIVLSSGFWHRRYGAAADVLGRRVVLDEQPFTIVGVIPSDLDYPAGVEAWRTTASVPADGPFGDAARREVNLVGRLRSGVTLQQATSEIVALTRRFESAAPSDGPRGVVPVVRPFAQVVVADVRAAMVALFAAVGLVLAIASANAANLLLMRVEGRRVELAVRAALGAGPGRILRLVIAESAVLALLAGVAGLAIAWSTLDVLVTLVPDGLPRVESIRVDAVVVLFAAGVAFVTAFLSGLGPARSSIRIDLVQQVNGGRGITPAATGRRLLIVAQVALAVTVVSAAGLLIRSVLRLQSVDLGLTAGRLVLIELHVPHTSLADRPRHAGLLDDLMARLEADPAVEAATPVNLPPFTGQGWDLPRFTAAGQSAADAASNPGLNLESIHPNYFATLGVGLVRGRAFTAADRDGAQPVAIVSDDVAEVLWPGQDPVGRRVKMGAPGSTSRWLTVVGVAAPTRYRELAHPRPTIYLPAAQFQMTATMVIVRTSATLQRIASLARSRVSTIDPGVQVLRVAPFDELLARPLARPRFNALLLALFGISAVLLSTIGIYAVMSAYVEGREREIALRIALGATPLRVRRLVLREAFRLAGAGAVIGIGGALVAGRVLRGVVFEIGPIDLPSIGMAGSILFAAAWFASYLPARRATRLDAITLVRGA
jgi:predicted permease